MTTTCERYVEELIAAQAARTYPGLFDALDGAPLCVLDGFGDGLKTVSFRQRQLPERYLRGVLGFRLAQFLRTGLIDPKLVHRRRMVHEPIVEAAGPDTIHTVTMTDAGRIVGYIALVGSPDPAPLPLDAPDRGLFPAEAAHHVELLSRVAGPGLTTHHAYEIKRFVRAQEMARGEQRDRVPWHLILAVGRVTLSGDRIRILLGDSSERGALRHLRLMGMDPVVIEGTAPSLPRTELMWPSYRLPRERLAKPFVAPVPDVGAHFVDAVQASLELVTDGHWQQEAIARLMGVLA
jgi:hypothetical protein